MSTPTPSPLAAASALVSDFATRLINAVVPDVIEITDNFGQKHQLQMKLSMVRQTRIMKLFGEIQNDPEVMAHASRLMESGSESRADVMAALFNALLSMGGNMKVTRFLGEAFAIAHPEVSMAIAKSVASSPGLSEEAEDAGHIAAALDAGEVLKGLLPFVQLFFRKLAEMMEAGKKASKAK